MSETKSGSAEAAKSAFPAFVNAASRHETVPLDWPIEYDGITWAAITVRRMTTADIAAFAAQAAVDAAPVPTRFPMFDAPDAVLDMLDVDDADRLNEVVQRFLPRRFQAAAASAPPPAAGAASPPA
jgi:hypothetical protein